jgi:site-specific DNA recombinase
MEHDMKLPKGTPSSQRVLMNKAVIYARVSSKEQEREGYSIPAQLKLLREYASQKGLEVVETFAEAETAKVAGRRAFKRMLAFLAEHIEVRVVLAEKTDRLYRNFKDYTALDVEGMGLELHLVKENEILSATSRSHQKFIHGIKVLMAKNYIDNLGEEVVKGLGQKAAEGKWPSCAPIGYHNTRGPSAIEPDATEGPLVRHAFELAATGNYTLQTLRAELLSLGLRSRRAKRILSKEEVRRILTNLIYTGDFEWKGEEHKGKHEPLISRELFDRVQDVLGKKVRPRKRKHDFAFTGLIRCVHCGGAVTAESKKGGRYTYYRCARQCDGVQYLAESDVSTQLGEAVRRISVDSAIVEWTRAALVASDAERAQYHEAAIKTLSDRRAKLTGYVDQAYQDRLDGSITVEIWQRKASEWEHERAEIATKIEAHEKATATYFAEGVRLLELAQVAALGYHLTIRNAA